MVRSVREDAMIKPPGFTAVFLTSSQPTRHAYLRFLQEDLVAQSERCIARRAAVWPKRRSCSATRRSWSRTRTAGQPDPRHLLPIRRRCGRCDGTRARSRGRTVRGGRGSTLRRPSGRRTRSVRQYLVDLAAARRWAVSNPIEGIVTTQFRPFRTEQLLPGTGRLLM